MSVSLSDTGFIQYSSYQMLTTWENEKQEEERTEAITSSSLLYPDKSL